MVARRNALLILFSGRCGDDYDGDDRGDDRDLDSLVRTEGPQTDVDDSYFYVFQDGVTARSSVDGSAAHL